MHIITLSTEMIKTYLTCICQTIDEYILMKWRHIWLIQNYYILRPYTINLFTNLFYPIQGFTLLSRDMEIPLHSRMANSQEAVKTDRRLTSRLKNLQIRRRSKKSERKLNMLKKRKKRRSILGRLMRNLQPNIQRNVVGKLNVGKTKLCTWVGRIYKIFHHYSSSLSWSLTE